MEKLLKLRKKFSSKIKMSKGEIVEMTYGNKIGFGNDLDIDINENKRIKEILKFYIIILNLL